MLIQEILELYVQYINNIFGNGLLDGESSDPIVAAKKRKLYPEVSETASDENEETKPSLNNSEISGNNSYKHLDRFHRG